jgi:hypothetical protein
MSHRTITSAQNVTVTVALGEYRKVAIAGVNGRSTNRVGTARLIVTADSLTYVNRNGVAVKQTEAEAFKTMTTGGINTLQATVAPIGAPTARNLPSTMVPVGGVKNAEVQSTPVAVELPASALILPGQSAPNTNTLILV